MIYFNYLDAQLAKFKLVLEFKGPNSRYSLNFPHNDMNNDDMKAIYDMFRSLVFRVFAEAIHSCRTDSVRSS